MTVFRLPLPPSKNTEPLHPMERVKWKNRYRRAVWAAMQGVVSPTTRPPDVVRIRAHFRTGMVWDEPNLWTGLNLVLDAIQAPKAGEMAPSWRQGIAERKGYIVDDSPRHVEIAEVTQGVVAGEPKRRGLTLTLEVVERARRESNRSR